MTKEKLFGIVRHVLTFGGGLLIAKGVISEGTLTEIIGALTSIIGVVWSVLSKKSD